ncbi:MAG: single-stranded-DNA-specific exonuclease RecJ [Firmicutes bacterium]|nr:single-stranded-DNA-specific exonuclease RecJ [Bacillota bacterium]
MEINHLIRELLANRGISSDAEIQEFLSTNPQKTHDPLLLPDMEAGADLILNEISAGSRIMIYGDYDADGITATTLMMSVLGHLMEGRPGDLSYYIPSRFEEGYGLNCDAIKAIKDMGFDMIVTVDCGSVSKDEVRFAEELGMKVLVTDHHNITDRMAECLLINPKKPGSEYPFKDLCGCGVAFKLAQVLQKKTGLPKRVLTEVLDLVAIGTIGDIMPLTDENRTLVKYGMRVINQGHRPGLRNLIEEACLRMGSIDSENVGFVIVPHLNASGRIEDASDAVRLLMADEDDPEMPSLVNSLIYKNRERKRLQADTYRKCLKLAEDGDFMLIRCDDAHEGIAGIVAGKIKDAFYRPTAIVMPTQGEEGLLKGTGRSIEGVSLYDILKKSEDLFIKFGGHSGACGFTMKEEDFGTLKANLQRDMAEIRERDPDIFTRKYPYDMDIKISDIDLDFAEQLKELAPFGNGNPKPVFKMKNVRIADVRYLGDEGQHMRFAARDEDGTSIDCIIFNRADRFKDMIGYGKRYDIIGTVDINEWRGKKRLQSMVENIIDYDRL